MHQQEADIYDQLQPRPALSRSIQGATSASVLTGYADAYNLLFIEDAAVADLYWAIKRAFGAYITQHQINVTRPVFIKAWANCFRDGESIKEHAHVGPSWLEITRAFSWSGTFGVEVPADGATATLFNGTTAGADEIYRHASHEGQFVIFPATLRHSSESPTAGQLTALATGCRITSSWDIKLSELSTLNHLLPLYDPHDPEWALDPSTTRMREYGIRMIMCEYAYNRHRGHIHAQTQNRLEAFDCNEAVPYGPHAS